MTVLRGLFKAMRPRQWSKNVVLMAAVIFDKQLSLRNPTPLIHTLLGLLLFCILSSSVYIINDLMDIEADRQHPKKRYRPIASGQLPKSVAIAAAVVMILVTLPLAYLLSPLFAWICLGYFLLNLAYTFRLKHIPLLDVLVLATFYVLRVAGGASIIHVERFSPWLYVVTTLGSLYLGFGKRRAELNLLAAGANAHRRVLEGYTIPFLDQLISIVTATTIIAYSLYTFSAPNLPENHTMMLTIPFVIYGIFRSLYLIQVQEAGGAPEELFLTDRPLQITILLYGLAVFIIFYLLPLFP
ncbi:MAG TPA: decaprenyl-phosphate phosphoribosyltransferase [Anaerolineaceae bacterium]|nr:decaprenyl-phosphate phosphoribosyltransferase [Anaerolineaceae bacterium]